MRQILPFALTAVPFLFNTGLQVSGFSSTTTTIVCWVLAAVILFTVAIYKARQWHISQKASGAMGVQAWHILFISLAGLWLFLSVAIGAAGWMVWTQQGFAVGNAAIGVGAGQDEGPLVWYRNLLLEGGPPVGRNVFSLTFRGGNVSQKEIELKGANIVSAINGTKIVLEVIAQGEAVPVEQIELVPPGAPVQLIAKFGAPDPAAPGKILGLDPKTFLEIWRQFSLNIQDDTRTYRISFNEGDLAAFFPGMAGPHVTKKSSAQKSGNVINQNVTSHGQQGGVTAHVVNESR
jgi:hypothetical protein